MNQLNRKLAPEIESMYIFASAHYSFLSSTGVKEMATFGGDVGDLVPEGVAKALVERSARLACQPAQSPCVDVGQELAVRPRKQKPRPALCPAT